MHKFWRSFLLFSFIAAIADANVLARNWTGRDGRQVEAEYLGSRDGKVRIKRTSDGRIFDLPLDRLSDADQEFVRQQIEAAKNAPPAGGKWKTTERLLLSADEAGQARDGMVWVSSDGKRVAYVKTVGAKECLVVDGKAEPLYDEVDTCRIYDDFIFFGDDNRYAYLATDKDPAEMVNLPNVVVDGKKIEGFDYWYKTFSVSRDGKTWSFVAFDLNAANGSAQKWFIVNGKQVHKIPFETATDSLLVNRNHFACIAFDLQNKSKSNYVICDGKAERAFNFVDPDSLTLGPNGAHGYAASDNIQSGMCFVVNGAASPYYKIVWDRSLTLSSDGKHFAFGALNQQGGSVLVVDGKEHLLPGSAMNPVFSLDGKRWAGAVNLKEGATVVVDGTVIGESYDEITELGDSITFSPDGKHLAYGAQIGEQQFVVADGVAQPPYVRVKNLFYSPQGKRLAYVAKLDKKGKEFVVCDGREESQYESISAGTINFGLDGKSLSYVARPAKKEEAGVLVIDGNERTHYEKIMPKPNNTLYIGADALAYVAVRDGAYYWVQEQRLEE